MGQGSFPPAIIDLSEALRISPKSVAALLLRGLSYENSKQDGKAAEDYRAALKLEPGNREATVALDRMRDKAVRSSPEFIQIRP